MFALFGVYLRAGGLTGLFLINYGMQIDINPSVTKYDLAKYKACEIKREVFSFYETFLRYSRGQCY